jgi:hypothetical protein
MPYFLQNFLPGKRTIPARVTSTALRATTLMESVDDWVRIVTIPEKIAF